MGAKCDFSGYATKNDLRCSDGRTIRKDAFKDCDGMVVPLVWSHCHDDPTNVLGHSLLENRADGVYSYNTFNETEKGQIAKNLVAHGDIKHLSIYANQLKQSGGDVLHGTIREVSLVLAGANPGAVIDFPILAHSGEEVEDEAIIYTDESIDNYLMHADDSEGTEETIEDIFNTLTPKQKDAVYAIIASLTEGGEEEDEDEEMEHDGMGEGSSDGAEGDGESEGDSDYDEDEDDYEDDDEGDLMSGPEAAEIFEKMTDKQKEAVYAIVAEMDNEGENNNMKHNVFDADYEYEGYLSHDDMEQIFNDAQKMGRLSDAIEYHQENGVLAHAIPTDGMVGPSSSTSTQTYGFRDPDMLFPEYKSLNNPPEWIKRDTTWVDVVMNGAHHTPFSRIKSQYANITEDDARARGYIKGKMKKEEVFTLLKRTTDPQTIYKKQRLDRDDIIDITDFDVVAWIRAEMRVMLDEEIARAALLGDGRNPASDDKIQENHIRPIASDVDLFTIKVPVVVGNGTSDMAKNFITEAIRNRKKYKGTGTPTLFTTADVHTEMLLLEDQIGHRLYKTDAELATALRVSQIVEVEVMESAKDSSGNPILGIIVNMSDYNIGADKGGEINMFDDFDIDYNRQKYLIETRCSGALVKPFSAMVLKAAPSGATGATGETGA